MSEMVRELTRGGIPVLEIETADSVAQVSPYGAHVLSFRPFEDDGRDLLWVSEKSNFTQGKAIRGGIPVCWPWFGNAGTPGHGIARIRMWETGELRKEPDGSATQTFRLTAEDFGLRARLDVTVGKSLTVRLTTENISDKPATLSEALHSYFSVGDIAETEILGLECDYQCKLVQKNFTQSGPIRFGGETDRIYDAGSRAAVIRDPVLGRKILVERFGSESAVVWNPWIEKSKNMADFGDEEYRNMLCIEAANAGGDIRVLGPRAKHELSTRISLLVG